MRTIQATEMNQVSGGLVAGAVATGPTLSERIFNANTSDTTVGQMANGNIVAFDNTGNFMIGTINEVRDDGITFTLRMNGNQGTCSINIDDNGIVSGSCVNSDGVEIINVPDVEDFINPYIV